MFGVWNDAFVRIYFSLASNLKPDFELNQILETKCWIFFKNFQVDCLVICEPTLFFERIDSRLQ